MGDVWIAPVGTRLVDMKSLGTTFASLTEGFTLLGEEADKMAKAFENLHLLQKKATISLTMNKVSRPLVGMLTGVYRWDRPLIHKGRKPR